MQNPWEEGVGVFGFYQNNICQTFTQQQELMVSGVHFIAPQMFKNGGDWINRPQGLLTSIHGAKLQMEQIF